LLTPSRKSYPQYPAARSHVVRFRRSRDSPRSAPSSRTECPQQLPTNLSDFSSSCKLMERMFRDVMMDHLYSNNVIATEQHGFVLKKSVVTNLLETVNQISDGMDKGFHVLVVFLDFVKAFDRVFAGDSKLIATIRSNSDLALLQHDLDALSEWSIKWRMLFNVDKCKVMEFSRSGKSHFAESELLMEDLGSRSRHLQDPLLRFRKNPSGRRRRCLVSAQQEKHEATGDRAEVSHQTSTEN